MHSFKSFFILFIFTAIFANSAEDTFANHDNEAIKKTIEKIVITRYKTPDEGESISRFCIRFKKAVRSATDDKFAIGIFVPLGLSKSQRQKRVVIDEKNISAASILDRFVDGIDAAWKVDKSVIIYPSKSDSKE